LFFFLVAGAAGSIVPDQASAQLGFLFGRFSLGFDGILGIAAVIPVLAALTAITSRLTVRRFLSQTSGL
jgi:cell division transport system permease protein